MWRFLIRRILQTVLTLFLLLIVVFVLARISGDPVSLLLPPEAGPEMIQQVRHNLGLDRPYHVQLLTFFKNVAAGDLRARRPVLDLIAERLPNSVSLAVIAAVIGIALGFPLAILAALKRGTWIDTSIQVFGSMGIAIPQFWLGLVLIQLFAGQLQWLPVGGAGTWKHYILPSLTLGAFFTSNLIRVLRSSMLEVMAADFITLARVKGLSETRTIGSHALRNAVVPVFTFGGILFALLMIGTVVTETVFAWPGFGRLAYEATIFRDFPLLQGVVIVSCVIVVGTNLLVNVAYAFLDPRIRYD